MIVRYPAAAVLAVVSVVLALASAGLASAVGASQPALLAAGIVATALVLAGTLALGRTAGTTAAIVALGTWGAVALATAEPLAPGPSAVLGATIYLAADTAFVSLGIRQPIRTLGVPLTTWSTRLAIAGVGGSVAYLLLRSLGEPPDATAGLTLAGVALTVVTLLVVVGVSTLRPRTRTSVRMRQM